MLLERVFLLPQGLPDRQNFRNAIFSPSKLNSYGKIHFWQSLVILKPKFLLNIIKIIIFSETQSMKLWTFWDIVDWILKCSLWSLFLTWKGSLFLTGLIAFDHFTDCQGAKAVEGRTELGIGFQWHLVSSLMVTVDKINTTKEKGRISSKKILY